MKFVLCLLSVILTIEVTIVSDIEAEESKEIYLEKIIVTNRRTNVGLGEATENVTVVSEEEIKKLPAKNLSDVLSYVAGVDIEPRQGFSRATSITIQGSDSRHVKVMIDGIPLNNQASGQLDPTKFPLENISRIEIIKGPASSIWGSSLGGVINIITKDTGTTEIPKGSITKTFAEFGTHKESFDLSGKVGNCGYYFFSSYLESKGKGSRDDVLEKKTFGKLSYNLKGKGRIKASFGYSGADVNSGRFPDSTWQAQPYRIRYGKIGWEEDFEDVNIRIDLKHSRQDIVTKSFLSVSDTEPSLIVRTKDVLYQLSLNSTFYPRGKDLLVVGADFDWDRLKSVYLNKERSLRLYAPYANYTLKLDQWHLNLGCRYDNNSEFGGEVSPSFGFVYNFNNPQDTLIRAGLSRAFNAPPLLWKHYELILSGLASNPDIKPERAWTYELGLESKLVSKLRIKLSLYRADVSDAIALAQNTLGQFFMKNFQKFRRQGGEIQFQINLWEGLNLFTAAAFNDIENRNTGETVRGGGKPRQSFDIGIEYKNKNGFSLYFKSYYDRWNQPPSAKPNDRKMLCDLKISQTFKNLTLFLNVYNLTNSKYWADFFFPIPQRYFEGGVTFQW
jgi:vitamin B12 transporter